MDMRRVTYKLYPTAQQIELLLDMLRLHQQLYNAALEERINAWRIAKKSVGLNDQYKSLTQIRKDDPRYRALNMQSAQVTLKRLDLAFQSFFERVKQGKTPGFPRFKSFERYSGFGYKSHGDGFKFFPGTGWKNGYLRLSGVGMMQARGRARTPGQIKACSIMRKVDGWYLSLVVECEAHREMREDAHEAGSLDWGVATFATVARGMDDFEEIENDRFWEAEAEAIAEEQRAFAKSGRGKKRTRKREKQKKKLAMRARKLANRRKNRSHQESHRLVTQHKLLASEELTISNMTRSASGTVEEPGKNVAQKAGLNRSILDTAPSGFLKMLTYKAEEAGCELIMLPTKKLKPSQRCPISWTVEKKTLAQRFHVLPDGRTIGRDHASALVMLRAALNLKGQEPAWVAAQPETPSKR
jgi:putative transposase